ncbi:predicted protein [Pyrenophora tritici-repentis Pt-1C-BFP]|uniref:Uncharacterized protein n=1 Tax=Pyrenophora tritici-repentis (strain Pt-1C-BFP) TaxID=426418 RepID=B2VWJ1_PYRTR|nr:uncharacterized protein PTRG_01553 [Pyrenophora tritici-repentis Pt-1C-BFP]EDU40991.1 predicted protein [Pyrenophora tritici-repentis Pt-1C-BFP]
MPELYSFPRHFHPRRAYARRKSVRLHEESTYGTWFPGRSEALSWPEDRNHTTSRVPRNLEHTHSAGSQTTIGASKSHE